MDDETSRATEVMLVNTDLGTLRYYYLKISNNFGSCGGSYLEKILGNAGGFRLLLNQKIP